MNERNFTVTGVLYVYQNKRYCNQSCGNLFLLREGFSEHEVIKYINLQNHACAIRRNTMYAGNTLTALRLKYKINVFGTPVAAPTNISCLENLLSFAIITIRLTIMQNTKVKKKCTGPS